jgi:hypothetical protein
MIFPDLQEQGRKDKLLTDLQNYRNNKDSFCLSFPAGQAGHFIKNPIAP